MIELKNTLFRKEADRLHMNISKIIKSSLDAGWEYQTSIPTFTRIYGIISGEGMIFAGGKEIPMTEGNIYILPTGMDFRYICRTNMEKIYFHINMRQYNSYDIFTFMNSVAVLKNESELIHTLSECFERNDTYGALTIKSHLMDIVVRGFEATETDLGEITEYSPMVKQVIQYIETHLHASLTVSAIVNELYISESRLRNTFKKEVGTTLGKYISDRLFFVAEQQLRMTKKPIKEISAELGFCDPFYFSRCFTSRYKITPSSYRKQFSS